MQLSNRTQRIFWQKTLFSLQAKDQGLLENAEKGRAVHAMHAPQHALVRFWGQQSREHPGQGHGDRQFSAGRTNQWLSASHLGRGAHAILVWDLSIRYSRGS